MCVDAFQSASNEGGASIAAATSLASSRTLTYKDHDQIAMCLGDLSNREIANVGVMLGLRYSRFKKMNPESFMDDMVLAWLRKDDDIDEKTGDPSWYTLCQALEDCGHNGIASNIKRRGI